MTARDKHEYLVDRFELDNSSYRYPGYLTIFEVLKYRQEIPVTVTVVDWNFLIFFDQT
jgi:hypothetical protein